MRIRPTPVRERIDFFGAIGSAASTKVMAELGLAPMCTSFGQLTPDLLPAWEAAADAAGTRHTTARLRPLLVNVIVADTDDDAVEEAKAYMTRFMDAQVRHYGASVVDIAGIRGYEAWTATFEGWKRLTDPDNIPQWTDAQIIGSPETCARRVQAFADAGFDHIILHTVTPGAPREAQQRWAERFAREVAPRFSSAFDAVAGAMIVRVADDGAVALDDAADCKRLHVEAADAAGAAAALEAAGAGRALDDEHVLLDVDWLAHESAGIADPDAFAAMLAYAGSKGWTTPDGRAVRAHLA